MSAKVSEVVLHEGRNTRTFARFLVDDLRLGGRNRALDVSILLLRGRRSTSDVS